MWNWHKSCTFLYIKSGMGVLAGVWLLVPVSLAVEDIGRLSDPTRPAVGAESPAVPGKAAAPTGPQLQSTMISPTFRRAVISGRSYNVGDKFDGAVIADIQPYEVTLRREGRETRLRLLPRLTK